MNRRQLSDHCMSRHSSVLPTCRRNVQQRVSEWVRDWMSECAKNDSFWQISAAQCNHFLKTNCTIGWPVAVRRSDSGNCKQTKYVRPLANNEVQTKEDAPTIAALWPLLRTLLLCLWDLQYSVEYSTRNATKKWFRLRFLQQQKNVQLRLRETRLQPQNCTICRLENWPRKLTSIFANKSKIYSEFWLGFRINRLYTTLQTGPTVCRRGHPDTPQFMSDQSDQFLNSRPAAVSRRPWIRPGCAHCLPAVLDFLDPIISRHAIVRHDTALLRAEAAGLFQNSGVVRTLQITAGVHWVRRLRRRVRVADGGLIIMVFQFKEDFDERLVTDISCRVHPGHLEC